MDKAKIDRINELGRLAKQRELTEEEKQEREALRAEYIQYVRSQLRPELAKKD
jgi:uncharacterized protein YnzC (UPF0291/DUF896 family)